MESKNFSLNSWHWRLVSGVGTLRGAEYVEAGETYSTDICTYIRAVIKALIAVAIMTLLVLGIVFITAHGIAYLAAIILNGTFVEPNFHAIVFMVSAIVIISVLGLTYAHTKYREWKDERDYNKIVSNKPDSFVTAAYRKFKDKTCFRVEVR